MHTTTIKREWEFDVEHKWQVGDVIEWDYSPDTYEVIAVNIDPFSFKVTYDYKVISDRWTNGEIRHGRLLTDPSLRIAKPKPKPTREYTYYGRLTLPDHAYARLNLCDDLDAVLANHGVSGRFTYAPTARTEITLHTTL